VHPLLSRQLKKLGITEAKQLPTAELWPQILDRIGRTYEESDQDRYTLERSLSLSSEEMQELHRKLAKQNAVLNQILTTYVAEDVAKEILANPEEKLKLGGATRLVSVLFADIRNYTGLAKSKDASLIIQFLNRIFERLVPIIFDERGTLDKFMGDAVMAFYGAPISYDEDPLRAVRTALRMQEAMHTLRDEDESLAEVAIGAGIYTGYAVVGNLGSERLMNYTCVGDTPNAAKRLQENATANQILICPATYEAVSDAVVVKPMGPMMLKGRVTPVQAYEVLGLKSSGH
jgi:adenylate cyclase